MNLRKLAFLVLLAAATPACISNPSDSDSGADAGVETGTGDFELTFVSGHLGNYWDCPGEANGAGTPAGSEAAGDAAAGACAPGFEESCNSPLNCEAAMVVVEVTNTGDTDLGDLNIESIEMIDADGTTVLLEGLGVFATTEPAPGPLTPGGSRQVRVEFRGPPYSGANDVPERHLRIVLSNSDAGSAEVTTPAVYSLPAVAT